MALMLALGATVLAALWPADEASTFAAAPRPRVAAPPREPAAPAHLPDRSALAQGVLRDPFAAAAAVRVVVAPQTAPAAAPPPAPPTLPWQYGGRLIVPGQPPAVLLNDAARTHTLAVGDTLGEWRLDADRGTQLEFTHLPSGQSLLHPLVH